MKRLPEHLFLLLLLLYPLPFFSSSFTSIYPWDPWHRPYFRPRLNQHWLSSFEFCLDRELDSIHYAIDYSQFVQPLLLFCASRIPKVCQLLSNTLSAAFAPIFSYSIYRMYPAFSIFLFLFPVFCSFCRSAATTATPTMPCYIPFLRSGSLGIPPEFFPLRLYSDCLYRLYAETASVTVENHRGGLFPSVSAD